MEISASRLLAPYFGTSLFVWTNIIGIVLTALACGYYLGGKLADRRPQLNILLRLILAAGILFLIIPWTIKPLTSFIDVSTLTTQGASVAVFVSSLIVTIILFSLPLLLLGMVSPFIIKLYSLAKADQIGESAGLVFAVSTVGSILGTFLPTLYFIPVLGTKATINIFATLLILLGSLGLRKNKLHLATLIVLLLIITYAVRSTIKNNLNLIFEDESAYQYISVIQDYKGIRYLLFNEGGGIQSAYDSKQILVDMYFDYFNVLPYLIASNQPKRVLIIGLAGGTIANQLHYFFKEEIEIEGVEIDKKVINAGKKYFALDESIVKIHNQDGRMFLRNSQTKYDLIIIDAYQNELYIPWTLTTLEFWNLIKDRLTSGGMVAINVNSINRESDLLNSITNTIASVFDNTYITPVQAGPWNYIITAAQTRLNFESMAKSINNPELGDLTAIFVNQTEVVKFNEKNMILTDDRAPIEFMTEAMAFDLLRSLAL
ncbi:MAG: hypothetical protein A3J62_04135 [Candidatus Buchananbacteria bacterium RIFCSPHIGHO2_02_FULL_38_8]|nr:MAG: hypothetical protein A3J62_04135 [Candidatus Buchananbacteria bacterium RIFCSPHIGHO2_02_FULL_38_8]